MPPLPHGEIFDADCGGRRDACGVWWNELVDMVSPEPQFIRMEIGSNPTEMRSCLSAGL